MPPYERETNHDTRHVVGEVGERIIDGEPYPPMWQVRPEEGPAAFIVVEIVKAETTLTVLK